MQTIKTWIFGHHKCKWNKEKNVKNHYAIHSWQVQQILQLFSWLPNKIIVNNLIGNCVWNRWIEIFSEYHCVVYLIPFIILNDIVWNVIIMFKVHVFVLCIRFVNGGNVANYANHLMKPLEPRPVKCVHRQITRVSHFAP